MGFESIYCCNLDDYYLLIYSRSPSIGREEEERKKGGGNCRYLLIQCRLWRTLESVLLQMGILGSRDLPLEGGLYCLLYISLMNVGSRVLEILVFRWSVETRGLYPAIISLYR